MTTSAATPAAATPSSTTGAEGDAAIEAIKSSKSSRVQLAAPLLCSPAVKQIVGMIWSHCQGRVADPLNADDLDNAKPPDTTTSPPPSAAAVSDEVASSISLLVDYHARTQEPPATAEQRAAKRDALSSLLLSECGGKFDPFASIAYLLIGDADVARALRRCGESSLTTHADARAALTIEFSRKRSARTLLSTKLL